MIVVRASKLPFSQHSFMQEKFVLRVFDECLTTLLTCFNTILRSSFQSSKCKILTFYKYQDCYFIEHVNRLHELFSVYCSCYILSKYTELCL